MRQRAICRTEWTDKAEQGGCVPDGVIDSRRAASVSSDTIFTGSLPRRRPVRPSVHAAVATEVASDPSPDPPGRVFQGQSPRKHRQRWPGGKALGWSAEGRRFCQPAWPGGKALGWSAEGRRFCQPAWPGGKALGWSAEGRTFDSPLRLTFLFKQCD